MTLSGDAEWPKVADAVIEAIKSMVVMCSSVPGRVLRFLPAWRKCMTMTIRLTRTIGFEDTNTIG